MATSLTEQKPLYKKSQVLPSNFHLKDKLYAGFLIIGNTHLQTEWFESKEEAELELRCLEKINSYELVKTVEMEGFYPERATILEEKYQASGRTNGLYTGLNMSDGKILNDTAN